MQDRRSSVSESVLVEVFFIGKAVFRNAGALRTAFPRRSVGTIIKPRPAWNMGYEEGKVKLRALRVFVVNFNIFLLATYP